MSKLRFSGRNGHKHDINFPFLFPRWILPKFSTMLELGWRSPPVCCLWASSRPWPTNWPRPRSSTGWDICVWGWRCSPSTPSSSVSYQQDTNADVIDAFLKYYMINVLIPGYLLRFICVYSATPPPAGQNSFTSSDLVWTNFLWYNEWDF